MTASDTRQKVDEGTFLAEQFDIAPHKAADLVAPHSGQSSEVETEVRRKLRTGDDPLAGVPTPRSSDDLTADTDETRLKPVLRNGNDRTGAG